PCRTALRMVQRWSLQQRRRIASCRLAHSERVPCCAPKPKNFTQAEPSGNSALSKEAWAATIPPGLGNIHLPRTCLQRTWIGIRGWGQRRRSRLILFCSRAGVAGGSMELVWPATYLFTCSAGCNLFSELMKLPNERRLLAAF